MMVLCPQYNSHSISYCHPRPYSRHPRPPFCHPRESGDLAPKARCRESILSRFDGLVGLRITVSRNLDKIPACETVKVFTRRHCYNSANQPIE